MSSPSSKPCGSPLLPTSPSPPLLEEEKEPIHETYDPIPTTADCLPDQSESSTVSSMPLIKQNVIIISALTCSGKSTLAGVPSLITATSNDNTHLQQFKTYTGPTVGEFRNKPDKKALYTQHETRVRLFHGYEVLDLDPAPYRLEPGAKTTTTHDFARYRADILKLNAYASSGGVGPGVIILVSTHDPTREFLCREGWCYWLVYPAKHLRKAWVQRLRNRDAGNPDRAKMDRFAKALDDRFEMFVDGMVKGLSVENGERQAGGGSSDSGNAGRSSFIAVDGRVIRLAASNSAGAAAASSASRVQWLEIQDAKMGLRDVVPFITAQQKRLV